LRVEDAHDVVDRAVLARRVEALQHDQERVPAVRREERLQLLEPPEMARGLGRRGRLVLVEAGIAGVDLVELKLVVGFDDEALGVVLDPPCPPVMTTRLDAWFAPPPEAPGRAATA
jgi:hypothetical protein